MSEDNENKKGGKLTLGSSRLKLNKTIDPSRIRLTPSDTHGITVEIKKRRSVAGQPKPKPIKPATLPREGSSPDARMLRAKGALRTKSKAGGRPSRPTGDKSRNDLSRNEQDTRLQALREEARRQAQSEIRLKGEAIEKARLEQLAQGRKLQENADIERQQKEQKQIEAEGLARKKGEEEARKQLDREEAQRKAAKVAHQKSFATPEPQETVAQKRSRMFDEQKRRTQTTKPSQGRGRRGGRLTVSQALSGGDRDRGRSMAALRRARQKEKMRYQQGIKHEKISREVIVPEIITVGDLANRMAERVADVLKSLMAMGMIVSQNQTIDADTAELLVEEFGHRIKRVTDADVEIGLTDETQEDEKDLEPRAPIVTVMGHVDHGKTSLLDALRSADVVAGEAGGITQHIGAYQVQLSASNTPITFLDTPGHEAFTAMRMRGAQVTDIVILVVAADDGIQPQTVEAINHAKAAEVPIIVAINKMDKPDADPLRIRNQLLEHGLVAEEMGGDILAVEVSAKKNMNLDKLEEAILLQAEMLELKANPNRLAQGSVVEARMEKGRGAVATVLVMKGTLKKGDIFVAGAQWGRVKALENDRGKSIKKAGPSVPVEILGLQGVPKAGDDFTVVKRESRAREIAAYRQGKRKEAQLAVRTGKGTLEQMFEQIKAREVNELSVVIRADVQGSLEAISSSLTKMDTDEVKVRILHGAVGGITESDVTLAAATGGIIIGFNVRANSKAREISHRDGVDIRYYSVIYNVIDDIKALMGGLLAPEIREKLLGNAEIRTVFNITKVGKVGGSMVTDGIVKRGAKVRLLRDNVVIHEGSLKTLRRFKDNVKEVAQGYECGMAFENYEDIKVGDVIECFELEEITRTL